MELTERDPATLEQLVLGYRLSRALYSVTELGIPDLLTKAPASADELATAAGLHPDRLRRLMRYLASEHIFAEDAKGRFSPTPISRRMSSEAPDSARAMMLGWHGLPAAYEAFGQLSGSLRTGQAAFVHAHGAHFHDFLASHPDGASAYGAAMESTVEGFEAAATAYDFGGMRTVVDVGGSEGSFLIAILRQYPHLRGVLFELPHVADRAPVRLAKYPESDRIDVVAGDMLESVPPGADGYILSTVLRCFDESDCTRILRNCRAVMRPRGRVVALEMVVALGPAPAQAKTDVVAMAIYGGRDRTEAEWSDLVRASGMELVKVVSADGPFSWLEAR